MLSVLESIIRIILRAYQVVLIITAVISWIPDLQNSLIHSVTYALTEPVLSVVRNMLKKLNIGTALPVDISFLLVYIFIVILIRVI